MVSRSKSNLSLFTCKISLCPTHRVGDRAFQIFSSFCCAQVFPWKGKKSKHAFKDWSHDNFCTESFLTILSWLTRTLTMSLCDQIWTGSISSGVWDLIPNVFRVAWSWLDSEITATWTIALMLPFVWKISEKTFIEHCRNHIEKSYWFKSMPEPQNLVLSESPRLQRLHYSYI